MRVRGIESIIARCAFVLAFSGIVFFSIAAVAWAAESEDPESVAESAPAPLNEETVVPGAQAAPSPVPSDELGNVTEEEVVQEPSETGRVADPLEPVNRFFFTFNDKLYFWVLKPAAKGYGKAVPEDFRVLFGNFYKNITAPIRIVNKLLQLKLKDTGTELARLAINSTVGVGGLRDCAGECFGIRMRDADFGQTLGYYGAGKGFYLVWPLLGPSTARDTVGFGFDWFLYPGTWLVTTPVSAGTRIHDRVNSLSFRLGDYDALKKAAVDPYLAVRNAYVQNREASLLRAKEGSEEENGGGAAEVDRNRP